MSETPGPITLTLDIGGTGLKAGRLDQEGVMIGERVRVPTPHPSPPADVVPILTGMAGTIGPFDRVSVGGKVVVLPMNGHGLAQSQRPAPAPVLRQRVSGTYQSDAPRPAAVVVVEFPGHPVNADAGGVRWAAAGVAGVDR